MKKIAKIYCWFFGHDAHDEGRFENPGGQFGEIVCFRCGYRHMWQYDL